MSQLTSEVMIDKTFERCEREYGLPCEDGFVDTIKENIADVVETTLSQTKVPLIITIVPLNENGKKYRIRYSVCFS